MIEEVFNEPISGGIVASKRTPRVEVLEGVVRDTKGIGMSWILDTHGRYEWYIRNLGPERRGKRREEEWLSIAANTWLRVTGPLPRRKFGMRPRLGRHGNLI